ncbi:MAG: hypothetical protein U0556_15730 [Dehalococcoidia bacterium]
MTRLIAGLVLATVLLAGVPPVGRAAPPEAIRIGVREDSFGVAHITTPGVLPDPKRVRQAVEMGAAWDRFPVYFYEVQETKGGPFKWDRYDATVNADLAAGINPQGIMLGYPKWGPSGDWLKDWEIYVREAATRYKGKIKVWEVWNEPDLKADNGEGVFWKGSPADYYDLLKVSYRTLKAVDPTITVLFAGLSFTWNNQDWFPRFLDVLSKDTSAKENNFYFDALALHQYGRPSTLFDLPVGYVGKPSFDGFHGLMQQKGFDKPIWANEVGVPIWNLGTGQNGPGRATADEAANFIWQAFAYGFAAGLDKIFIFQLYDDGASSIDPGTKQPADYFGLVSNGGEVRPSYRTYQLAVDYLSGAKLVTRVNLGRKFKMGAKGWDAITFWGGQEGKVTIAWSNIGQAAEIVIPATTQKAKLLDKFGKSKEISASNGGYLLAAGGDQQQQLRLYQWRMRPRGFHHRRRGPNPRRGRQERPGGGDQRHWSRQYLAIHPLLDAARRFGRGLELRRSGQGRRRRVARLDCRIAANLGGLWRTSRFPGAVREDLPIPGAGEGPGRQGDRNRLPAKPARLDDGAGRESLDRSNSGAGSGGNRLPANR